MKAIFNRLSKVESYLIPPKAQPWPVYVELFGLTLAEREQAIKAAELANPGAMLILVDCPTCEDSDDGR